MQFCNVNIMLHKALFTNLPGKKCVQQFLPYCLGGGGGVEWGVREILSHTTRVLAATLKPLKLWLPNYVTSSFYLFVTTVEKKDLLS